MILNVSVSIPVAPASPDCEQRLLNAVITSDPERLREILNSLDMEASLCDQGIDTDPLMMRAVCDGHLEIVRLLLEAGATVNTQTSCYYGETPIHTAAERGFSEIVDLLLKYGASWKTDTSFPDPLELAAAAGHPQTVKVLLLSGRCSIGDAVHKAAENNHVSVLEVFKEMGHDLDAWACETESVAGNTPVEMAISGRAWDAMKYLVENKARLNGRSVAGGQGPKTTCLHLAVQTGEAWAVQYLVKHGANRTRTNDRGEKAVDIAATLERTKLVDILTTPVPLSGKLPDWSKVSDIRAFCFYNRRYSVDFSVPAVSSWRDSEQPFPPFLF